MTRGSKFQQEYLTALDLPKGTAKLNPTVEALIRAHELRKFEIENYWKRATYFWAFQIAAFGLLGLIWKEAGAPGGIDRLALLLPAGLGAVSAQVGWLTAKGSKFWQENWEAHVDMLEESHEGRLTQVIISDSGPQFSVSAVNQNFMLLLMLGWLLAFAIVIYQPLEAALRNLAPAFASLSLILSMLFLAGWSRTSLKGWRYQPSHAQWHPYEAVSEKKWFNVALKTWFEAVLMDRFVRITPKAPEIVLRDTAQGPSTKPGVSQ